eukprot:gene9293-6533_t
MKMERYSELSLDGDGCCYQRMWHVIMHHPRLQHVNFFIPLSSHVVIRMDETLKTIKGGREKEKPTIGQDSARRLL